MHSAYIFIHDDAERLYNNTYVKVQTLDVYAQQRFMVCVVCLQHSINEVVNRRIITKVITRN